MRAIEPEEIIAGISRAVLGMARAPSPAHVRALAEGLFSLVQGAPVLEASATPAARAPAETCTTCRAAPRDGGFKSCGPCRRKAAAYSKLKRDRGTAHTKAPAASPKASAREKRAAPAPADASPSADEEPPGVLSYAKFRAGVDFNTAYQMLWSGSDDRQDWKQKGRGIVLGLMSRWKREAYAAYLERATRPVQPCAPTCFCSRCRAD